METELLDFCIPARPGDIMAPVEVKLEANGRVLLPAEVRRKLDIKPGDTLMLDVRADGILLWTRAMAARDLQAAVSRSVPAAASLVGELSELRRTEQQSFVMKVAEPRKARPRGKR